MIESTIMKEQLLNRFIEYVKIDTQSDENSETVPSTEKQFDLAKVLVEELTRAGLDTVTLDDQCYVYAGLNSNIPPDHPAYQKTPRIGFIAHLDTSPSVTGKNVNPQIIEDYQGGDIKLNDAFTITDRENPVLKKYHLLLQ